jgi:hypothetical protein
VINVRILRSGFWIDGVDQGIYCYGLKSSLWAIWGPDLPSAKEAGRDVLVDLVFDLLVSQL